MLPFQCVHFISHDVLSQCGKSARHHCSLFLTQPIQPIHSTQLTSHPYTSSTLHCRPRNRALRLLTSTIRCSISIKIQHGPDPSGPVASPAATHSKNNPQIESIALRCDRFLTLQNQPHAAYPMTSGEDRTSLDVPSAATHPHAALLSRQRSVKPLATSSSSWPSSPKP